MRGTVSHPGKDELAARDAVRLMDAQNKIPFLFDRLNDYWPFETIAAGIYYAVNHGADVISR